jgi:8-oxo-dGTP diphosphatase
LQQYRHVGVYGVCMERDKLLVIQKARGPHTGKWDLPGGTIEHGEAPEDTLHREWEEETGIVGIEHCLRSVESYQLQYMMRTEVEEDLHHLGILYHVKLTVGSIHLKADGDGEDSLGAAWVPIAELTKANSTPFVCQVVSDFMMEQKD